MITAKLTPAPWSFEYDSTASVDPFTAKTYGEDWPITGNIPGMSLDGDGDYKPCFCRVKFAPSLSLEDQKEHAQLMAAALDLLTALSACKEIAENKALPPSARLELIRDCASPIIAKARGEL